MAKVPTRVAYVAREVFTLFLTRAIDEHYTADGLHAYINAPYDSVTVDAPDGSFLNVPVAKSWRVL